MISITHPKDEDEEMIKSDINPWIKYLNTLWDIRFEQCEPPTEDKVTQINLVTPRSHGYGDVTATYIRRSEMPSRVYAKYQYMQESECGSTVVYIFQQKSTST